MAQVPPTPEQIRWAKEIVRRASREAAQQHLIPFCQHIHPWYEPGRHHWFVARHLEWMERSITGRLNPALYPEDKEPLLRLIIEEPPRHGKTQEATIDFIAWFLGRNPDMRAILTSYGDELAGDFGQQIRDICGSDEYLELGWKPPAHGSKKRDNWGIEGHRGGLRAAGRGSSITGRGANLIIFDDPVKDAEEALSPRVQQTSWDWYESTARTRLEPDGGMIMVLTRWHKKDLAGKALAQQAMGGKTKWLELKLPALAHEDDPMGRQPGEALWPERWPAKSFEELKESVWWFPLFDQNPQDPAGSLYKRAWLEDHMVDVDPGCTQYYRFWDCAAKVKELNDMTASVLMGRGDTAHRYIVDCTYERMTFPDARSRIKNKAQNDPLGTIICIEDTSNGIALAQDLQADPEMGAYAIWNIAVPDDKAVRAAPCAGASKMGLVHVVKGHLDPTNGQYVTNKWVMPLVDNLVDYPMAELGDDIFDAASGANNAAFGHGPTMHLAPAVESGEPLPEGVKSEGEARKELPRDLLEHIQKITGGRFQA